MTEAEMRAACDLLYRHWQDETRIDALPPGLRPSDRAEGYRIQAFIQTYSKQPLFGRKIAATSAAGQAHIGVDGPLAGRLLAERGIADGGSCALGNTIMRVAELEFAFRMAEDLPVRAAPYAQDEVMDAVATLHPAIEIPDSRYERFERAGPPQIVADNACAHRYVIGTATTADWRALDLSRHKVLTVINGAMVREGVGANVLGDPRIALTWLANELSRHGMMPGAGQTIITGTCIAPIAIAPGDRLVGDFGLLGKVSLNIA